MREIKLRVWAPTTARMLQVASIHTYSDESKLEFLDYPLMQYTGLRDKQGKEIYEGDIIPTPWGNAVITWSDDFAGFYASRGATHIALTEIQAEVIGNIYEHPELVGKT